VATEQAGEFGCDHGEANCTHLAIIQELRDWYVGVYSALSVSRAERWMLCIAIGRQLEQIQVRMEACSRRPLDTTDVNGEEPV
jgi:hypothetical protein